MLAHYRLVEKIGEGGMGMVWKAVDTTLNRHVALKNLPEAYARDAERLARFEREARVLAALNHPGIAAIHGLHEADGLHFLEMELVPGEDLSARLSRGPLPTDEAIAIALHVAEALEAAGAARRVADAEGLARVFGLWLERPAEATEEGRRGRRLVEEHRGATARSVARLARLLEGGAGAERP